MHTCRRKFPRKSFFFAILIAFAGVSFAASGAQTSGAQAEQKKTVRPDNWVARSNQNAQLLLDVDTRFNPESTSRLGFDVADEQVMDLKPGVESRRRQAYAQALAILQQRRAEEKDPLVRQDLEILILDAQDEIHGSELQEKYEVPYYNMERRIFGGMRAVLDDQVPQERRQRALARLKRYAGMEAGYTPVTELAEQRMRERMNVPGLLAPARIEVEKDLGNADFFIHGIGELFDKYKIAGYQEAFARLQQQLAGYEKFLRGDVLPRARADFRLPPEEYAFRLHDLGVDIPPNQVAAMAHAAFTEIQGEMAGLASQVAKQKGYKSADYRDVIRELKKDQIVGPAILPHFQQRLKDLEEIIRREHLVTLPAREARIRLASAAESASTPAPNFHAPRLLGNTGEEGEFVLPLNIPAPPGSKEATQKFDDFTFSAASWTLTAHEARPGHELQFSSMLEHGVSQARAVYAFNSTNVEGWGLYAEAICQPYMPPDGQLISLQLRLMRAARAFLDPELQAGKVTPEQAKRVLMQDVGLSDAFSNSEVERYTFWAPGQATSYFYGYTRLMELRRDTEKIMGKRFNQQAFHDFILAQGLLPPPLLRKAVMEGFVKPPPAIEPKASGN
jgi:uncharacterized protein (DUF885 family)